MKTVQIITLGCSKNTVDSEHIMAALPLSEYVVRDENWKGAVDCLLINTCGFIGDAKEESVEAILEAVRKKQEGLAGKLIVFGCLSQRYSKELPEEIPEVDEWYGARDIDEVIRALGAEPDKPNSRFTLAPKPYAYLKISEGCDRRCSYCAIPMIRGAHRSVPMEDLVEEASFLAAKGVRELILIAQDTTYYGLDLYGKRMLAELLRRLSAVRGIEWLRIHYSYPADFPVDVLEEMASNPKVCKYIDIPLQHVSDNVLKCMHRHVDGAFTRALIKRFRESVPGVVLRTTMIVGHPGEGEKDFDELIDFVREARFERLGAFTYSEEEGTWGAGHLEDSLSQEEKNRRLDALMSLQASISLEAGRSRVGSVVRVLVDSWQDGTLVCRSEFESPEVDGEILVRSGDESLVGKFIDVRILAADEYDMIAEIV